MKTIQIFTDGACSGNPGPGGWGTILVYGDHRKELSGGRANTTNNQMELQSVIEGLKSLKEKCEVIITTDSTYVKDGITLWIQNWKRNGWRTAKKTPVKNEDLWRELDEFVSKHSCTWKWVKGHSGHPENERCDELARLQSEIFKT